MYSASAVERATVLCFLLRHDTGPPAMQNMYPDVDFLSPVSPAQSASEKAMGTSELSPLKTIHTLQVPFRYRNTRFAAVLA